MDPEARIMKMGDGGFRLAYNVQFATGTRSRVIYGVSVVNTLDPGTVLSLMARVYSRGYKLKIDPPKNWIADSGYSTKQDIENSHLFFPQTRFVSAGKAIKKSNYKKFKDVDSDAMKEWREFVDSEKYQEIYSQRCSTAEFSNAQVKNHGFRNFQLIGLLKARGEACLHAITHNMMRFWDLKKYKKVYS